MVNGNIATKEEILEYELFANNVLFCHYKWYFCVLIALIIIVINWEGALRQPISCFGAWCVSETSSCARQNWPRKLCITVEIHWQEKCISIETAWKD
jgi:hypothetical protein